jgi:hypothetical protein
MEAITARRKRSEHGGMIRYRRHACQILLAAHD